jgi:hypothetical protein
MLTHRTSTSLLTHKAVQTIYMRGNWRTCQVHMTPLSTAARSYLTLAHLIQEALHELNDVLLLIARKNLRYVMSSISQCRELRAPCTPTENL